MGFFKRLLSFFSGNKVPKRPNAPLKDPFGDTVAEFQYYIKRYSEAKALLRDSEKRLLDGVKRAQTSTAKAKVSGGYIDLTLNQDFKPKAEVILSAPKRRYGQFIAAIGDVELNGDQVLGRKGIFGVKVYARDSAVSVLGKQRKALDTLKGFIEGKTLRLSKEEKKALEKIGDSLKSLRAEINLMLKVFNKAYLPNTDGGAEFNPMRGHEITKVLLQGERETEELIALFKRNYTGKIIKHSSRATLNAFSSNYSKFAAPFLKEVSELLFELMEAEQKVDAHSFDVFKRKIELKAQKLQKEFHEAQFFFNELSTEFIKASNGLPLEIRKNLSELKDTVAKMSNYLDSEKGLRAALAESRWHLEPEHKTGISNRPFRFINNHLQSLLQQASTAGKQINITFRKYKQQSTPIEAESQAVKAKLNQLLREKASNPEHKKRIRHVKSELLDLELEEKGPVYFEDRTFLIAKVLLAHIIPVYLAYDDLSVAQNEKKKADRILSNLLRKNKGGFQANVDRLLSSIEQQLLSELGSCENELKSVRRVKGSNLPVNRGPDKSLARFYANLVTFADHFRSFIASGSNIPKVSSRVVQIQNQLWETDKKLYNLHSSLGQLMNQQEGNYKMLVAYRREQTDSQFYVNFDTISFDQVRATISNSINTIKQELQKEGEKTLAVGAVA